jgi:hypothetical protein
MMSLAGLPLAIVGYCGTTSSLALNFDQWAWRLMLRKASLPTLSLAVAVSIRTLYVCRTQYEYLSPFLEAGETRVWILPAVLVSGLFPAGGDSCDPVLAAGSFRPIDKRGWLGNPEGATESKLDRHASNKTFTNRRRWLLLCTSVIRPLKDLFFWLNQHAGPQLT